MKKLTFILIGIFLLADIASAQEVKATNRVLPTNLVMTIRASETVSLKDSKDLVTFEVVSMHREVRTTTTLTKQTLPVPAGSTVTGLVARPGNYTVSESKFHMHLVFVNAVIPGYDPPGPGNGWMMNINADAETVPGKDVFNGYVRGNVSEDDLAIPAETLITIRVKSTSWQQNL